jgi:hypothetical protein
VLISHVCKFIYLKTLKTGGTSVEIYFEPFCVDPAKREGDSHGRDPETSDWGVVGSRGYSDETWYNHMAASRIRELAGETVWRDYFKFCVVRNPFDKVVSYFWHDIAPPVRDHLKNVDFSAVRDTFGRWVEFRRLPRDRGIYCIEGEVAVDRFLRYERLQQDLEEVCRRLTIPWQPARLGRFKSDTRLRHENFHEYYTEASAAVVREEFGWELNYFGYA